MAATLRPISTSSVGNTIKKSKLDKTRSNIWSSLLDSVASSKRLPEKRIVLLGGSPTTQREFLEVLNSRSQRRGQERQRQKPAIANDFALGYTYQEVLDADQEDVLARLSIYTLQSSTPGFSSLIEPLLTPNAIPDSLLIILLDWSEPWSWVVQLRDWIRLIQETMLKIGADSKIAVQEVMQDWEQQRRGGSYDMGLTNSPPEPDITIPLGPGEWGEPLGLPLCVVCHNADQIDVLEREHGWREDDFDHVLQFMRTILLKHGASLVYTSNSIPNSSPLLIQYSLGIRSILKREPLKHNIIDRDKILIPPNWDSWGKIKVLREGFDIEGISKNWSLEIQYADDSEKNGYQPRIGSGDVVKSWEEIVKDPATTSSILPSSNPEGGLETQTIAMQAFLTKQMETIERFKLEEDGSAAKGIGKTSSADSASDITTIDESSRVKEYVGPIQFNMGGINLDAEDMLNHIKERGNVRSNSPEKPKDNSSLPSTPESSRQQGQQKDPEALASFFASLIKKSGGSSGANTPTRGTR